MNMCKILKINPLEPEADLIGQAARILQGGGVIGYPTETVYGIGCNAFDAEAVNRIFQLKHRDRSKAMILIAADLLQISDLVENIPESAERLMENFWPGPLTMVFKSSQFLKAFAFRKSKTIAVRIPNGAICLSLLKTCDFPIVSTSANRSGEPDATTADELITTFGNDLDLIIDGGRTPSKAPSTVVDLTRNPPRILREGIISVLEINTVLKTEYY
ncbi:MAG: threonylcarbamoyl-AMP synthase [Actinobacteria bacterium]|nr:threonylcarbamoyl-AMP synthase [Actinomycetota bacterium]